MLGFAAGMPASRCSRAKPLRAQVVECEEERAMADDKNKIRPQDMQRVNVNEPYELRAWCRKFGCSEEQLKQAVAAAGVMATDVEAWLKKNT